VKDDFLHKKYNEQKLWGFSEKIVSKFGYDFSRGRQDKAPHPFETSFSVMMFVSRTALKQAAPLRLFSAPCMNQVMPCTNRASTRVRTYSACKWHIAGCTRIAITYVGKSCWSFASVLRTFLPRIEKSLPSQLDGVTAKSFYKGINKVEPSLIRVNADEATYNLHIMLRLEIEIAWWMQHRRQ